ncbi:MAG: hypothetical protein ACRDJ1_10425 [Actinomycetota bacterium]
MRIRSIAGRATLLASAALVMSACAGAGAGLPRIVADAEPIPGGCPPSICPQHTPTQPPPPDEPDPTPTATASKPKPKPSQTAPGSVPPGPGNPTPLPTQSGAPAPPVVPSTVRFAAFPFSDLPFDQAFPIDAPPPPAPLSLPPPTALVALAAALAAGVAAATSMAARRRALIPISVPSGGGPA